MGEFSADWLSLREPADAAARSAAVTDDLVGRFAGRDSVRVLDLATGTGANLRYLAPKLPSRQRWTLVDRDSDLLAHVPRRVASWALGRGCIVAGDPAGFVVRGAELDCHVECRHADLSKLDEVAFFEGRDVVTASALLDLVSDRWLQALVTACAGTGAAVLLALTYDGRMTCAPEDPDDGLVRDLVNRHQRRAKGFGRALGPGAADEAIRLLAGAGYDCRREQSDWQLTPAHSALQRRLIEGWAEAAGEMSPKESDRLSQWQARRLAWIDEGRAEVVVGHVDLGAWPRS